LSDSDDTTASAGAEPSDQDSAATLDWQIAPLIRSTRIDSAFRVTQNVMRFFRRSCGQNFAMEREFQAWLCDGTPKTLGEAADAWNEYADTAMSDDRSSSS